MSRTFTSPRAIGLGLIALLLMAGMGWLGLWQYSAYDSHQREAARERLTEHPVPLEDVFGPDDAFPSEGVGRPVTVTGEFVAADEVYVRDFDRDAAGLAHATPLRTDQGAAILVVRGWSEGVGDHAPPAGPRTITGVLEPSQANGSPIDDDRVAEGLRISALVPAFGYDLYAGYVVLDQDDPARMGLAPLEPPLPDPSRWAGARNLVYAVQWWVFAGFVAFMWWRMVSETGSRRTARVL